MKVHGIALAALLAPVTFIGVAQAASSPTVTFAQVNDTASSDGLTLTNNGVSSATLNTSVATGDMVSFTYENVANLPNYLSGQLSAVELINNSAGVTTTAQASGGNGGYDVQAFNSPFTISYLLAGRATGQNNLLTVTITPKLAGGNGMTIIGPDGGQSFSSSATNQANASYTETFSSDFLKFQANSTLTAGWVSSALNPDLEIDPDGLLSDFTADIVATFSSNPPPAFIPEPGTVALLGAGLAGLTMVLRRRRA